ncbi:unnamed protein product [Cuscuta campestris]|uniref:Uncharacterized protein n=1 Tax=Cuscuta campestris TaxID=132261 RepID=A0A484M2R2_9ASTE|nr:unnamed protein product [Cuscuta campestris]
MSISMQHLASLVRIRWAVLESMIHGFPKVLATDIIVGKSAMFESSFESYANKELFDCQQVEVPASSAYQCILKILTELSFFFQNTEEYLQWTTQPIQDLSFKEAFNIIQQQEEGEIILPLQITWSSKQIPKVAFFQWRLYLNLLPFPPTLTKFGRNSLPSIYVGGDDEVHDEEGVWQAPLSGDGGAIRHVDHHEFRPIDGGAVDDGMNRLQVLVEERGVAAVPGAENPGDDVEEEALVWWGRVNRRCAAVADQVGDPKLTNDDRLVVEDPIVATIGCDVVTADGKPCDPSKGRQINLYVVEIDAAANGVPVTAEIGVEGSHKGKIEARATTGDERPQTRCLKLIVEVVVPLLLRVQLGQHPRRRNGTLGKVREEPVEFLLRPELQEGSVQIWERRRRGA